MFSRGLIASLLVAAGVSFIGAGVSHAADDLLKTIKDRGKMRVCHAEYAPWNVKNPATNKWEGIDIDIINIIAKEYLKVEVEDVDATFGTIIPSMNTQKCDFTVAPFYISAPRAELISYTKPFATDGITIFVSSNSTAKTFEELDVPGKTSAFLVFFT